MSRYLGQGWAGGLWLDLLWGNPAHHLPGFQSMFTASPLEGYDIFFVEATSTPLKSGKRITLKQETEKKE